MLTNRAGRTEMTRSMLCAVGLFLGLLIAPGARAYPTGKVVELTEANFDAEVRPFPHVSLLPRGRGLPSRMARGSRVSLPVRSTLTDRPQRLPSPVAHAGGERTDADRRVRGLVWT